MRGKCEKNIYELQVKIMKINEGKSHGKPKASSQDTFKVSTIFLNFLNFIAHLLKLLEYLTTAQLQI